MGSAQAFPGTCIIKHLSFVRIFKRKLCVSTAKLSRDSDPLLLSATAYASLRYHESLRPEPLFLDPYAGCFVPDNTSEDVMHDLHPYCLATRFIDDKLLHTISLIDGLKQLVFLTDGMDTRPYRLQLPSSTIIFDISAESVFEFAAEKLKDAGVKMSKDCIFYHISLGSSNMEQAMQFKGYSGNRPSIWVLQGFPMMTLANFEELVSMISSLAMKGSLFLGELPACLVETDKSNIRQWVDKLFMSKGFRVEMINYERIAKSYGKDFATGHNNSILFAAEQLLHSDDQMESWRREFQRIENEGDEDGFEEL